MGANSAPAPVAANQPSSANPTTAGAAASSNANSSQLNTSNTISSLADLQQKAPAVYLAMLQGLAMNICNDWQQQQQRLKELQEQGNSQ